MKKKNQRSRRQPISNAKQAQKIVVPVFFNKR
ncbi:hypothetical protein LTSEMIN_2266, partial [Salmonella enterica subsp. enterica serovar Minnesota str. A4-603]